MRFAGCTDRNCLRDCPTRRGRRFSGRSGRPSPILRKPSTRSSRPPPRGPSACSVSTSGHSCPEACATQSERSFLERCGRRSPRLKRPPSPTRGQPPPQCSRPLRLRQTLLQQSSLPESSLPESSLPESSLPGPREPRPQLLDLRPRPHPLRRHPCPQSCTSCRHYPYGVYVTGLRPLCRLRPPRLY